MNENIDENKRIEQIEQKIEQIGLLIAIIGLMVTVVIAAGFILTLLLIQQSKTNETVTIEGKVMIAQAEEDSDKLHFVELNEGVAIKADICYSELDPDQWENNCSRVRCFALVTIVGRDGYSFKFERDSNSNYKIDYNLYVDPMLQPIEEVNRTLTTQIPAGTVENNITVTGPTFYLVKH